MSRIFMAHTVAHCGHGAPSTTTTRHDEQKLALPRQGTFTVRPTGTSSSSCGRWVFLSRKRKW